MRALCLQPLVPVINPHPTVTVMAAGSAQQFAGPLPGLDRPAFSYLALGALRGWGDADKNGAVTPREATDYARDALRLLVRDRQQTPEATGPDRNSPLFSGVTEAGPDLVNMAVKRHSTGSERGSDGERAADAEGSFQESRSGANQPGCGLCAQRPDRDEVH